MPEDPPGPLTKRSDLPPRKTSDEIQGPEVLSREDLSFVERFGSWVLLVAGVGGWALATWQSDKEAVATAWVVAGFVLFAASAFFQRVMKVGREGVELRNVVYKTLNYVRVAPVVEGDTTDEAKTRALRYAASRIATELFMSDADVIDQAPASPQLLTGSSGIESSLAGVITRWLEQHGYEVRAEGYDAVRTDLVAARKAQTIYVEVRGSVDVLRPEDAATIAAGRRGEGGEAPDRALVLREDARATQDVLKLLAADDIAVWSANPETGSVHVLVPGRLTDVR